MTHPINLKQMDKIGSSNKGFASPPVATSHKKIYLYRYKQHTCTSFKFLQAK
ncbi:hypothetical protein F511_24354 [Dorcoceras hygrometricum]|uniref:Uncharacterized protein n=1 Tax=Dorcoceras hygrometricum TaxID=472368 RepID=A0A2Z7DF30_9LAMI|nr:hypothetical protein F511_24354 [Dorcoceras hygrometricum]